MIRHDASQFDLGLLDLQYLENGNDIEFSLKLASLLHLINCSRYDVGIAGIIDKRAGKLESRR